MTGFNDHYRTSDAGVAEIVHSEGEVLTAYFDSAGVPTIGVGHTKTVTASDVHAMRSITQGQSRQLLKQDLFDAESAVKRLVKVPLYQSQFDALVSFTFNLGEGALARSTLLKHLNNSDYHLVPFEFSRWVYATNARTGKKEKLRGLVSRRAREAEMFAREIARDDPPARNVEPAPIRRERATLSRSRTMYGGAASLAGTATSTVSGVTASTGALSEQVPWFPSVLAGLVVAGLVVAMIGGAVVLYARRDDFLRAQG